MHGKGTILRLIDVVLIILVGFVAITDHDQKVRLDLPVSDPDVPEQEVLNLLEISVVTTGEYLVDTREADNPEHLGQMIEILVPEYQFAIRLEEGKKKEKMTAADPSELSFLLTELMQRFAIIEQVALLPEDLSPVEGTVAVYDICQALNLPVPAIDLSTEDQE